MESRQLKYFREIVCCRSMSAAARTLGIAQPSLSQTVRTLEESLGLELLIRSPRGITPTEAGERLYQHARLIEKALETARADVMNVGLSPAGRVVFGMPPSISMALCIPMAETIRLEMPNVQFSATEAMTGHLRDWVMSGEIDLALLYDNANVGDCTSDLLLTEELWLYSATDTWPLDTPPGQPITLGEIEKAELVLPSQRHGLRKFIDRVARTERLTLQVIIEMDSMPQIKALVARGSGFTILSPAAVHDMVTEGLLIGSPIEKSRLTRDVFLVRSARSPVTTASRLTEQLCRKVITDLVKRSIWQGVLSSRP